MRDHPAAFIPLPPRLGHRGLTAWGAVSEA
jgi:hypothetical protein